MGKALLEDAAMGPGGEADVDNPRQPENNATLTENLSCSEASDDGLKTCREEEADPPIANRNIRAKPLQTEQVLPPIPRKSSARKGREAIHNRNSPRAGRITGSATGLPKPRTGAVNPLGMNPTKLTTSSSMPLANLSVPSGGNQRPSGSTDSIDAEQISRKIEMMLAATQSLKPDSKIPKSHTTSKISRVGKPNGLFRKVSNAIAGKLFSRGRSNGVQGEKEDVIEPTDCCSRAPTPELGTGSTSSIELRLNEGKNLNNAKVQRLTGGRIQRKPLPCDGKSLQRNKSLRRHKSSDDPFCGPSPRRAPTDFENRLRANSADGSVLSPLTPTNPFEDEKILEGNQESILTTAPVASSTPRKRAERVPQCTESPTKKPRGMSSSRVFDENHLTSQHEHAPPRPDEEVALLGPSYYRNHKVSTDCSDTLQKTPCTYSYVPVQDSFDRKRHPSPAKADLELMRKDFRAHYPHLPVVPAAEQDETDELAYRTVMIARVPDVPDSAPLAVDDGRGPSAEEQKTGVHKRPGQQDQSLTTSVSNPLGIIRSQTDNWPTSQRFADHPEPDELHMDEPEVTYPYSLLGSQQVY